MFQARKRNIFGISWNSKDLGMQASVFKILKNIYSVIMVTSVTMRDLFY